MSIKIIKRQEQQTSEWSGGTTTQLYIFPEESSYLDKTFNFRISSAKVEVEESTFTKLEGISRDIMVLDGELKLMHNGRYSKLLKQFSTEQFQGDWDTISQGKVIDFNLMTRGENKGSINHINLAKDNTSILEVNKNYNVIAIYPYTGEIRINYQNKVLDLEEKDMAVFFIREKNIHNSLNITSIRNSDIIISKIKCVDL